MEQFEEIIEMEAGHILNVFGEYDKYVKKLEKYLSVTIVDRDGGCLLYTSLRRKLRRQVRQYRETAANCRTSLRLLRRKPLRKTRMLRTKAPGAH